MNDRDLEAYCEQIAIEICEDAENIEQAGDWAHEAADMSEYVIYYHKAHQLCQSCDIKDGEEFVQECFSDKFHTYDELACLIAYGELRARIGHYVAQIWEEKEAAA